MSFQSLIHDFYFIKNSTYPILKGSLHSELVCELDNFTVECTNIKNNTLGFLKNHYNAGMNSFQVSVPSLLLKDSYLYAFLNHLGEYYIEKTRNLSKDETFRKVILRENQGHFDCYDFWLNFINNNDVNELHRHSGTISGVIYYDNSINFPTYFDDGTEVLGQKGDIILFPATAWHGVRKNNTNQTRLTYAFNMEYLNDC